jgi:type II restriction enzyme
MIHPMLTKANATKNFRAKTIAQRKLINETLEFLDLCGLPLDRETPRGWEGIAIAFLALGNVNPTNGWSEIQSARTPRFIKTRTVIEYVNAHFREKISPGSYDDIRRRFLLWPTLAGIVVSSVGSARNDPSRGWGIADEFADLARQIGKPGWQEAVRKYMAGRATLREEFAQPRDLKAMDVTMSDGSKLILTPGAHNELQKAVVEEFLPRYGFDATVLYVGDAANKSLYLDEKGLKEINMFSLDHGELPDVVALSKSKGWLYLIEAFHSTGPMSPERVLVLKKLTDCCSLPCIYVTAFSDRDTFKKNSHDIAWETEVWIATEPDHLIHYNGGKFMGPH